MNCPYCGTTNPGQARFCLHCGQALLNGLVCPACYTLLPPYARYCFHCGAIVVLHGQKIVSATVPAPPPLVAPAPISQAVAAPALEETDLAPAPPLLPKPDVTHPELPVPRPIAEMLPSLKRYLPQALYEPLERRPTAHHLNQVRDHLMALLDTSKTYLPRPVIENPRPAGQPAGGMSQGVFLFGDVSGFTPLSEQLKPLGQVGAELITELINNLFTELVQVLFRHGGTLLKFGGDALLGFFAAADDAELAVNALRAVQTALEFQQVMEQPQFATIQVGDAVRALRIKCGISAGPYFSAHIGSTQSMAFVTTGRTVNRADAAEGHANPGDVVITEAVYELVGAQLEVMPAEKEPEPGFYKVLVAPSGEHTDARFVVVEPPEGAVEAQITYLVNRLDLLAPYMNTELLRRIVNNPRNIRISPDHRPVTVMFINYLGISDLIEELGTSYPEIITQQLSNYFAYMAEIVERYEGTLARIDQYTTGDRLVVFFGAPRAHEDDPVRAVRTALDMQRAVREHFAALQTPAGVYRFEQRIGINTGALFAGNAGAPNLRQEYTLMGDDINMAARLMSYAAWGQVLISKKTKERVMDYFELTDKGEIKVKGKDLLIHTFTVERQREDLSQLHVLHPNDPPMVGRDEELARLLALVRVLQDEHTTRPGRGYGQIVTVLGESGLGKSRLLRETLSALQQQADGGQLLHITVQGLSFSEQISYWLAAQLLRNALNLPSNANENDVLFNLWEQGGELMGRETAREAVPFLAQMMGIELEGEWGQLVRGLDPQVRQKQTFWAAREYFTLLARKQPTVVAIDDLHWADEASLALLEDLFSVTDRAPLVFILVFRPQREKGCWRLRSKADSAFHHRYAEIRLVNLSEPHSAELLELFLPGAEFTPEVRQRILDKAGGNPFYLGEVVRSLIETGAVTPLETRDDAFDNIASFARSLKRKGERSDASKPKRWQVTSKIETIAVPDTLQGAIIARIDRLTEDARQALQMAAVIGRHFQTEVLSGLTQTESELAGWLAQLERSDLIQATQESTYMFNDALIQEVAYENLLVQRRQEFHRRVGETLEKTLGARAAQESALLAHHFKQGRDFPHALKYLELAAHKAQEDFSNETAIQLYSDVLELLPQVHGSASGEPQATALLRRQAIYGLRGQQRERERDIQALLALAEGLGDESRYADALTELADLYQWTGRYTEAEQTAREVLRIQQTLGHAAGQAAALHQLGAIAYIRGEHAQAQPLLEQAVALRRQIGDTKGEAWSVMYLGMIHLFAGNYSEAARLHEHARELAQQRQDMFQLGIHLTNAARVALRVGEYARALAEFEQSLEMKTRVGDRMGQGFSLFGIGMAQLALGELEAAEARLQASLSLRQQINDRRGVAYTLEGLGRVTLARGEYAQAETQLAEAVKLYTELGLKAELIPARAQLARAQLGQGQAETALSTSQQAITGLQEQPNVEEVQQVYLVHYRALLANAAPEAGDYLRQAEAAMLSQAERIGDADLRQVFLAQVRVNREIGEIGMRDA